MGVRAMSVDCGTNVIRYLQQAAEKNPDRTAIIMPAGPSVRQVSYAELWTSVGRVAAGLLERGLRPGDRIILMIPMSVELYMTMLGIIKMGAVAVFVDPWVSAQRIAAFCAFASPRGFIGITKSHMLRFLHSTLLTLPVTVTTGRCFLNLPAKYTLASLLACCGSSDMASVGESDTALITFTTGSSGIPKGANRTHGFLNAQHKALTAEFPVEKNDVDMPMFPVFALRNLAEGITSVFPDMDFQAVAAVDAATIYKQLTTYKVTTCTASPPFFDRLADYILENSLPAPGLRRVLSGGAPIRNEQLARWRKALPATDIQVVYGSTEAEPVAHIALEERLAAPDNPGYCMGRPTSLLRTKIIPIRKAAIFCSDWQELDLEDGTVGELLVSGEHVCKDYYNNPDAVRENKITGPDNTVWHRMGDTGYFDGRGRFWLVGRVHSTMYRDGAAGHPQLLEQAAQSKDSRIVRAAAVGLPDAKLGERIVVVVQAAHGDSGMEEAMRQRLAAAGYPCDEVVVTSRPLPLDPRHNSKIEYGQLRSQLLGRK